MTTAVTFWRGVRKRRQAVKGHCLIERTTRFAMTKSTKTHAQGRVSSPH